MNIFISINVRNFFYFFYFFLMDKGIIFMINQVNKNKYIYFHTLIVLDIKG